MSARRRASGSLLGLLLVGLGCGALGWAGGYYWYANAPAPLPTAEFDIGRPSDGATGVPPAVADPGPSSGSAAPPVRLSANALSVPSLEIEAEVVAFGVRNDELELPPPAQVAIYEGGAFPGEPSGTVLIAGHVNSRTLGRGALFNLAEIKPGASVWVSDGSGRAVEYEVVSLKTLRKEALPQDVFARGGTPRLVIVTCGGNIIRTPTGSHYESNVIVTAVPTGARA